MSLSNMLATNAPVSAPAAAADTGFTSKRTLPPLSGHLLSGHLSLPAILLAYDVMHSPIRMHFVYLLC